MRHATFRQLRVFDAIVRHGSFSRAAEEMGVSQPTLSMQIRKIADSVGLPLFEQVGKRVYLTEAGKALHRLCGEVFASVARFDQEVADQMGLQSGSLRVAAVTTAEYFVPRLIAPFANRYPRIEVALEVANRARVLERLRRNLDDLYVFGQPPQELDVVARPFLENPVVVVAPDVHPLAGRGHLALADLAGEHFIMREAASGTRMLAEQLFASRGLTPRTRMELGSNEAVKQAVLGGLGLAVLSRHALAGTPGLIELDVEGLPLVRHWYLVWPTGKQLTAAARALADHLQAAARA